MAFVMEKQKKEIRSFLENLGGRIVRSNALPLRTTGHFSIFTEALDHPGTGKQF